MAQIPGLAPIRTFADLEAEWGARARADAEARRNGPTMRDENTAADTARQLEARRITAREGYPAREAAEAVLRQAAEASQRQPLVNTGGGASHRVGRLLTTGTVESLRADLRTAIAARDAADVRHGEANAELSACRTTIASIEDKLAVLTEDDEDKAARAFSNWRSGQLGAGHDYDMELDREAESVRLDDARRAADVLSANVGEAHADLLNCKVEAQALAAALVTAQVDVFAAALEEAEQRAATLRTLLLSGGDTWFTAPGMTAPIKPQATDQMRRLAMGQPANALAVADKTVTAAFQRHFVELLTDADAPLAALLQT
jgi:hypothetical protein